MSGLLPIFALNGSFGSLRMTSEDSCLTVIASAAKQSPVNGEIAASVLDEAKVNDRSQI